MCSLCISFPGGSGEVLSACVGLVVGFLPAATVGFVTTVFSVGLSVWCAECRVYWSSLCPLYMRACIVSIHIYHLHSYFYIPWVCLGYFFFLLLLYLFLLFS